MASAVPSLSSDFLYFACLSISSLGLMALRQQLHRAASTFRESFSGRSLTPAFGAGKYASPTLVATHDRIKQAWDIVQGCGDHVGGCGPSAVDDD